VRDVARLDDVEITGHDDRAIEPVEPKQRPGHDTWEGTLALVAAALRAVP